MVAGGAGLILGLIQQATNRAESGAVTVRIDNGAPGAVPVGVGGGETWRNANDFDVAWANPSEGDRAPIAAAHFGRRLASYPAKVHRRDPGVARRHLLHPFGGIASMGTGVV